MRVLTCLLFLTAPLLGQTTHRVHLDGSADYTNIQTALDDASDGDTVLVAPGEYIIMEPIDFNRLQDPENPDSPPFKNLVLRSETGAGETTIRMSEAPADPERASVVIIGGASTLEGFTITGGRGLVSDRFGSFGGGIVARGSSVSIQECRVIGNSADSGAGLEAFGGTVSDCTFEENVSPGNRAWGSIVGVTGDLDVNNSRFERNVTGFHPVGFPHPVFCVERARLSLTNSVVAGNRAAGVWTDIADAVVTNCTFVGNQGEATSWGQQSTLELRNSILWMNGREHSASLEESNCTEDPLFVRNGFWQDFGTPDDPTDDSWFPGDFRLRHGSPCHSSGSLENAPSTDIVGNPRPCGDGIDMGAYESCAGRTLTVSLDGGADFDNIQDALDSSGSGDTVVVSSGEYVITEPVEFNRLHERGNPGSPPLKNLVLRSKAGALETTIRMSDTSADPERASVVIIDGASTLEGFTVTGGRGRVAPVGSLGGGVEAWDSSSIRACRVIGNTADFGAGLSGTGSVNVNGCTFEGNVCSSDGVSGSIDVRKGSLSLSNSIVAGNRAAGVWTDIAEAYVTNCTIVGNQGEATSLGIKSWVELRNSILWLNGSEHSASLEETNCTEDPLFVRNGSWDDMGTPADTSDDVWIPGDYRLQAGSPCIDVGTFEGAPTIDLDGNPRPCGGGIDTGAYEFVTNACLDGEPFVRGDADSTGEIDLTDAIFTLRHLFLGGGTPPCMDAADANDSGVVDLSDAVYSLGFQFLGEAQLPSPFPGCGTDETEDRVGCDESSCP